MHVLIVVVLSLSFSFAAAIGVNIQKLSMTKEEAKQLNLRRSPFLQPLWCFGMAIIILDAIGDFVFIGMAPQSLLAPLGSLGLGWNFILAPIFHTGEKVTKGIVTATIIIYIGTITTVSYAAGSAESYNTPKIIELSKNSQFIMYFILCITFQSCMSLLAYYDKIHKGSGYYCSMAGCFGGYTMVFAKSSSELLKYSITNHSLLHDWIPTNNPIPLLLVTCMILSVFVQMTLFNTALAKYEALVVGPIYQSFWNMFSITGGLLFFQEIKYMTLFDRIMYASGLCISLFGVILLVRQRRRSLLPTHSE